MKRYLLAILVMLLAGGPVGAQQYGGPPPGPAPDAGGGAPSIVGTWSNMSQGPGGQTETTYGFGQDGTFAMVQAAQSGSENRIWGTYQVTPDGLSGLQLVLQISGVLPTVFCAQTPGFAPHCSQTPNPGSMNGPVQILSDQQIVIAGETFGRDPNPTLLNLQIPQQLTVNTAPVQQPDIPQPVNPNIPQPVNPNIPDGGGMAGSPSDCDDLQQERLCAINNGHYEMEDGCRMCVSP
jgi:hypothetical protein